MRGARRVVGKSDPLAGIIPADAGSTRLRLHAGHIHWDHPRGCGEHPVALDGHMPGPGSSPRMRGAHPGQPCGGQSWRIIPADAGSTGDAPFVRRRREDHPRGCGEHAGIPWSTFFRRGSSPRMRGAHLADMCDLRVLRIIPADAGSTL